MIGISDAFSAFCLRVWAYICTGPCPKALTECSPLDFRRSSIPKRRREAEKQSYQSKDVRCIETTGQSSRKGRVVCVNLLKLSVSMQREAATKSEKEENNSNIFCVSSFVGVLYLVPSRSRKSCKLIPGVMPVACRYGQGKGLYGQVRATNIILHFCEYLIHP